MNQRNIGLTINLAGRFFNAFFVIGNQIIQFQKLVGLQLRQRIGMGNDFADAGHRQRIGDNAALTTHLQTVIPQIFNHPVINGLIFGQPFLGNAAFKTLENALNDV